MSQVIRSRSEIGWITTGGRMARLMPLLRKCMTGSLKPRNGADKGLEWQKKREGLTLPLMTACYCQFFMSSRISFLMYVLADWFVLER